MPVRARPGVPNIMTKNTRFVLIDNVLKLATVYAKRVPLGSFQFTDIPFDAEDIEAIRVYDFKDEA